MRSLQLLRAPSLLRDHRKLEDNLGHSFGAVNKHVPMQAPTAFRLWRYRFAMERGNLDTILDEWIAAPFVNVFRWFDKLERNWINLLSGRSKNRLDVIRDTDESEGS